MRRRVVNLVLVAFIAGSAYDTITDQEHWPFSQYPMFSGTWSSPTFTWLRLFGVTGDTISRWETGKRPIDRVAFALLGLLVQDQATGSTTKTLNALRTAASPRPLGKRVALKLAS